MATGDLPAFVRPMIVTRARGVLWVTLYLVLGGVRASWHGCGGSSPTVESAPGIGPDGRGVVDGFVRTGRVYNNESTWRGIQYGFVAYACGGVHAGQWMFSSSEEYLADREHCRGYLLRKPSGQWLVHNGSWTSGWIGSATLISCGSIARLTRTPTHAVGWHGCNGTPIVESAPGIAADYSDIVDQYSRTGESYNGKPTWQGASHRWIVYMCGRSGQWMFDSPQGAYLAGRGECRGHMRMRPSDAQWLVYNGSQWIDSVPLISCGGAETSATAEGPSRPGALLLAVCLLCWLI